MILIDLLGKQTTSDEARITIEKYGLHEVEDAPPFRRYIGSKRNGLDLLFENDLVIAIQIFVIPMRGFSKFPDALPFGLLEHMNSEDVLCSLGSPSAHDEYSSTYVFGHIKLVVNYDKMSQITYLNIGRSMVGA
jgi:hypothetical protein